MTDMDRKPSRMKIWVGIKRGLIRDPKHRLAMGETRWVFDYMVDIADWDTGEIKGWTDEAAAEDMGMQVRTLRDQRRKLAEAGYITCKQNQHNQDILIHKWVNPRSFSGEVINVPAPAAQGDALPPPSEIPQGTPQGYTQGYTEGGSQDVTPTSSPQSHQPLTSTSAPEAAAPNIFRLYEQEIGPISAFIADQLKDAEDTFGTQWVRLAIAEAVINSTTDSNKRSMKYIQAVLNGFKERGGPDVPRTKPARKGKPAGAQLQAGDQDVDYDALRAQAEIALGEQK